jgi:hypothetical protein
LVDALGRASGRAVPRVAGGRIWWEVLAVCLLSSLLYTGLHAELPIDDTLHFGPHIAAGVFEWDASHLLMQPAAVLWHRVLGFGGPARASQERFNTFCAALSLGILYLLLLRLGVKPVRRVVLTALGALSFNLLTLATSGHIKLAVLPFLTFSLYHAVLWERDVRAGGEGGWRRLTVSAVALGVAAGFLISSLLVAPFLALVVAVASFRAGGDARRALGRGLNVGLVCGAVAFAILAGGYVLAVPGPPSPEGFFGFLLAKAAVRPPFDGLVQSLAKATFGVVQSFVFVENLGAMLRTALGGDAASLQGHLRTLAAEGAVFLAALALLSWVYLEALLGLFRERGPVAVPWAFLLGALTFAIPWNLNEADFYFQIIFPTVVMMAAAAPSGRRRALHLALLALVAVTVLLGSAVPRKRYPLSRYNAELRAHLTDLDLVVHWFNWSGGPSLIFMDLPGVERLHLDRLYELSSDPDRVFPQAAAVFDRRLAAGGRVYLFGVLDGRTWHAPWPMLRPKGITRARLEGLFRERYAVLDHGEVAEIHCWELRPSAGRQSR